MKKAKIIQMAAIVVCTETGKEFGVRHAVDVQEWLDAGYELKGTKKVEADDQKTDPVVDKKEPENTDPVNTDPVNTETSYDDMSDEDFMEAVKDKLHDLKADDAKRVASIVGVEYTNKKDTMTLVEDKLAEDL